MKFTAREDVEFPIEQVWSQVSDFAKLEERARAKGVVLTRKGDGDLPSWSFRARLKGRQRDITASITELDAPQALAGLIEGKSLQAQSRLDLVPLGRSNTRLVVSIDVKPKTLGARLFVQSLRLARKRANRKFQARFSEVVAAILQDVQRA